MRIDRIPDSLAPLRILGEAMPVGARLAHSGDSAPIQGDVVLAPSTVCRDADALTAARQSRHRGELVAARAPIMGNLDLQS